MKAVRIHVHGGPEVLKFEELSLPEPSPRQARVKLFASGLNFIDIYYRKGLYKAELPLTLGLEGAGVVEAVGAGVTEVKAGDRVGFTGVPGAYATHCLVSADRLVGLPEKLSFEEAAASLLQGMTAHYLSHSTCPLKPGDTCLVHAAAGGVGQLLCQMAKMRGARVLATVSTEEKAKIAFQSGADEVILYTKADFSSQAKKMTGGKGVNVVYDSVGKETFLKSLDSLAPRGCLVLFGQSSGSVPPFDPQILNAKGSLFLTRPTLFHYTSTREELLKRAGDLFLWIVEGKLKVRVDRTFPLHSARQAHEAMENRETKGKYLLLP